MLNDFFVPVGLVFRVGGFFAVLVFSVFFRLLLVMLGLPNDGRGFLRKLQGWKRHQYVSRQHEEDG